MSRRPDGANGKSKSLYRKLAQELGDGIASGLFAPGTSLPSLRECATQRGLSMSTVTAAYRLLEDTGQIVARPQSGFYVCSELAEPTFTDQRMPTQAMEGVQVDLMTMVLEAQQRAGTIDLAFASPRGKRFYPSERLARITSSVLRRGGNLVASYAMPPGSKLLREQIANRNQRLGVAGTADSIVLTHGATEALHLALRATTQPGDTIGVEAPSYFNLYPLLANLNLKAIEIPTHPQTGLDISAVEKLLVEARLAAIVAMPTVQNPLGCTMPLDAKKRFAELVNRYQIPLIEDMVYAELQFLDPMAPPVKSFDAGGWVIACGGFSKTLAPDYRLGWLDGGRFNPTLRKLKFVSSASESQLLSEAVGTFLESGGYSHHLSVLKRLYSNQVAMVRGLLAQHFPDGTRATQPSGGFVIWIELPKELDSLALFQACLAKDIVIMPGQVYAKGPRYRHCIRLCCCQDVDERFIDAVRTVGRLARELLGQDVEVLAS